MRTMLNLVTITADSKYNVTESDFVGTLATMYSSDICIPR